MPTPKADAKAVLQILRGCVGRENAMTGSFIAWQLGRRDKYAYRPVQAAIRNLKRDGHLIVAAMDEEPRGYFIAATAEEWNRYSRPFLSRAKDIWETARVMEKSAAAKFGAADGPSKQLELGLR